MEPVRLSQHEGAAARGILYDGSLTLLFIVCGIVFVVGSSDLPPPRFDPLGGRAFPTVLGWMMIVLGAADLGQLAWRSRSENHNEFHESLSLQGIVRAILVILLTAGYALSMSFLGLRFAIVTTIFLAVTAQVLERTSLRKAAGLTAVFALFALVLEFLLKTVVYVDVP